MVAQPQHASRDPAIPAESTLRDRAGHRGHSGADRDNRAFSRPLPRRCLRRRTYQRQAPPAIIRPLVRHRPCWTRCAVQAGGRRSSFASGRDHRHHHGSADRYPARGNRRLFQRLGRDRHHARDRCLPHHPGPDSRNGIRRRARTGFEKRDDRRLARVVARLLPARSCERHRLAGCAVRGGRGVAGVEPAADIVPTHPAKRLPDRSGEGVDGCWLCGSDDRIIRVHRSRYPASYAGLGSDGIGRPQVSA